MIPTYGLSVNFLKKETYTGSCGNMRYLLKKEDDMLKACVYPEPYCFEVAKEEDKIWHETGFSEEGLEETLTWIEKQQSLF